MRWREREGEREITREVGIGRQGERMGG